jgi:hypothetical protein
MATDTAQTKWRIAGEEMNHCNCAWGCPCQFNALPTHGDCEGLIAFDIREDYYGGTRLDGVRFARIFRFPGPVHEGNGTRRLVIDERASPEQRAALLALDSGTQGYLLFEIFAAVCPNVLEPAVARIELEVDRENRRATVRIPGIAEGHAEPIKNSVTGEEHRARIVLPDGFEYKEAEMANAVSWKVTAGGPLEFQHANTYAQLNAFDWSNE